MNVRRIPVNINNEFEFGGFVFRIPSSNTDYAVVNTYKENFNYTNNALMDSVFVAFNSESNCLDFFNEKNEPITVHVLDVKK